MLLDIKSNKNVIHDPKLNQTKGKTWLAQNLCNENAKVVPDDDF